MVSWPCMLKLNGDDELIYLSSETELKLICNDLIYSEDDYVVDSAGHCFFIESNSGEVGLMPNNKIIAVCAACDLIRAHEFNKASLCLTKIRFVSVAEALRSLALAPIIHPKGEVG